MKEFADTRLLYENFAFNIRELLISLLEDEGIRFQEISHQVKDLDKLNEKLERKRTAGKSYKHIRDIPDLARVRIILYFKDDIDKVIGLVEKEFRFFHQESLDKEKFFLDQPDKFGYLSKHRVVCLNEKRNCLKEYKRFKNLRCEIQIRTVLQHAWAEIEHDIIYKSETSSDPIKKAETKRILSQNAAILEVADDNFVEIRKRYENYLKR